MACYPHMEKAKSKMNHKAFSLYQKSEIKYSILCTFLW